MRSPDHLNSARVARHGERMKAKGFQRIFVWVPKDKVKAVREFVAHLRREHEKTEG